LIALERSEFDFFAMGSPCGLLLFAQSASEAARVFARAIAEIRRIENLYSRYLPDSLLSRINGAAACGDAIDVDDETAFLIDHAYRLHARSDGLFDISSGLLRHIWNDGTQTTPRDEDIERILERVGLEKISWRRPRLSFPLAGMELDLGGVAKEYAADRAAAVCRREGLRHGLVDLGGDLALIGPQPDGAPWRIGVRNPLGGDDAVATLFVSDGGLATSGDYERFWTLEGRRFSHILDPGTGRPVEGLRSVTVVAESCLAAGTTATIALLKGAGGLTWLRASDAVHLYVDAYGEVAGSIALQAPPCQEALDERNCAIN
jgi:thiamine biosynthesis lipoprotein